MQFTCASIGSSSEMDRSSSEERDGALSPVPSLTGSSSSFASVSSLSSQPTTPKSTSSHSLHRFASRDSLYSPDDKFTQIPMVSPRERRSSSATVAASARRRKSLANLHTGGATTHTATPSRYLAPPLIPLEGKRLSRKHVEASRRSAKEALEEDLRALDLVGDSADKMVREDYALDCYLTSLDYLVKAWKTDISDVKTRKAIRARLQVLSDSLIAPQERLEQAHEPIASPYRRAASTRSATAESDAAAWQRSLPSKVSVVLNGPTVRYLLLWSSLLVLQILAVFERNQFGTDMCDKVRLCVEERFTCSESMPTQTQAATEDTAANVKLPEPDATLSTEPSKQKLCFDAALLPSPRISPSRHMRTEARKRQRASLAPSMEYDGEDQAD